jgi:hypothetical protein
MFFPGTPSVADAQMIAVAAGEDLTSMEIRLTPGRAITVSGVALDASGQLFQRPLLLSTSQRSGVPATPAVHVMPQPDGRFAFLNVAPGDYVLQAFTRGTNGAEFATQFVGVGDGDVTGLTVRTATGSTVSGHIRLEAVQSRAAPQDVQFNFVETDADLSPEGGTFRAKINDDWTFEYEGLFGPLLIRPIGRPGFLLKSVSVNGADVTDAVLPFGRRNQSLSDVEVVLTSRGAEASGSVADARAQPALACTVIVFPADRERWQPHSRFVKAARCDPDGTFTVRGLPTAEYLVAAVDRLQGSFASDSTRSGEWQDPAFLAALAPHAVRATLTEGQTVTLSLKLLIR